MTISIGIPGVFGIAVTEPEYSAKLIKIINTIKNINKIIGLPTTSPILLFVGHLYQKMLYQEY